MIHLNSELLLMSAISYWPKFRQRDCRQGPPSHCHLQSFLRRETDVKSSLLPPGLPSIPCLSNPSLAWEPAHTRSLFNSNVMHSPTASMDFSAWNKGPRARLYPPTERVGERQGGACSLLGGVWEGRAEALQVL